MPDLVDVDLDALAPPLKRARLGGKVYRLPGDMPLVLFFKIQAFGQRVERGEDEMAMLTELSEELLALFKVHQPTLKALPDMGVLVLLQALGAIYGGGPGEAPASTPTPRSRKKTASAKAPSSRRRTSR
jgi:hypothetical protein